MGGCCSSGRARSERVPVYLYCPPVLEHERFSSTHNTVSGLTSGILVDTNLDLSSPDTYRAPPAPLPYDMGIVHPQALPVNSEVDMGKNAPVTSMDTHPPERTFSDDRVEDSVQCKGLKHSNDSGNFEATKIDDCKSTKWNGPVDFEEEDCPICLEEYNMENPKMITKCGHHFHLCCMLEWMERSDVCPMCDQELKDTLKLEFDMKDIGSTGRILGMKIKRERNFGFIVSWKSTLQPTISLSTTEAEYVAMIEAAKEEIWLKCLLGDLGWHIDKVDIFCDSLSIICLSKDNVFHDKTKHIDIKYHFLKNEDMIKIMKVNTKDNLTDMFTKDIVKSKFKHCLDLLNVYCCC